MHCYLFYYWVAPAMRDKVGGPHKIFELADTLIAKGYQVTLFAPDIGYPEKQTHAFVVKVPVLVVPVIGMFFYEIMLLIKILTIPKNFQPTIVYCRIMTSLVPLCYALLKGIPYILEINDDPLVRYKAIRPFNIIKLLTVKTVDALSISFAASLIAASDKIKRSVAHAFKRSEQKLTVIQSGSNIRLFRPLEKEECRKSLSLALHASYVGFVGVQRFGNDYDTLLRSAKRVIESNSSVRYLVLGDEQWITTGKEKLKKLGLSDAFDLFGHVEYEKLPLFIGAMDICVAPFLKLWGETSAIKLFDYLACQRPVVTTKHEESIPHLFESQCVIPVEPEKPELFARAILDLLKNPGQMEQLGKNGRTFVERYYNREINADSILHIFKEASCRRT